MISALLTLPLSLALQTSSELPRDTAYIDPEPYINNRADSAQCAGRQFTGPGPMLVHFEAEIDESMTYFAWEIAKDIQFEEKESFHVLNLDYTFDETGIYYARFTTSNIDNTEETVSAENYVIQITESLLQIPNVITPDSPNGANQVFKVKYKSLKSFEIWIYNRWGNELYHSKNPEDGWDGTANGHTVPTGAYYYLIKATGTDGIKYNERGDINVLRTKEHSNSSY